MGREAPSHVARQLDILEEKSRRHQRGCSSKRGQVCWDLSSSSLAGHRSQRDRLFA